MDYSMPGFPVHHQLPEFIQTHVHCIIDAIQLSHPLSSSSPPTFNLSQHQGLFNESVLLSDGQSMEVSASASVLPMNIQDWFPLGWTGLIPPIQWVIKSCWFTSCFYKISISSSFPVLMPCFRALLSLSLMNKTALKLVFLLQALSSQNSCSKRSCILYSEEIFWKYCQISTQQHLNKKIQKEGPGMGIFWKRLR